MRDTSIEDGADRLDAVASLVPARSVVADVGTDHGLLPRRLLESGRAERCIASEPSRERLRKLRPYPDGHPLAGRLEVRVGDGLEVIRPADGVTVIVVAGLGGSTIARILRHPRLGSLGVHRLVLQPQSDAAIVRRWLVEHRWRLAEERLALDRGRFYPLIAAEPGDEPLEHPRLGRDDLLEAGPRLVESRSPRVVAYWRAWLERHERILARARRGPGRDEAVRQRDLAARVLGALHPPAET